MNPKGRFRRILLLLWKNYLLRKRHYVYTALELLCPTLFIFLVAILQSGGTDTQMPERPIQAARSERTIFMRRDPSQNICMAYTPNNPETMWLMQKLREDIGDIFGAGLTLKVFTSEDQIETSILNQQRADLTAQREQEYRFRNPGRDRDDKNENENSTEKKEENPRIAFAIILVKISSSNDVKFSYKIRFPSNGDLGKTDQFFQPSGDRYGDNNYYGRLDTYLASGFTILQIKLDKILIQNLTSNASIPNINIQPFPYPISLARTLSRTRRIDNEGILLNLLILGFMFIVPTIVLNVVSEKQSGIKELMKIMGLPNWMHWLGWMLNSLITHIISITIIVFLLCGSGSHPFLDLSDASVIWVSLFLYLVSCTAFFFFISVFFEIPMIANIVAVVIWLTTYYGPSRALEGDMKREYTLGNRMVTALLPNYAFALLFKAIFGLENKGLGARWGFIAEPMSKLDPLTVGHSWLMFIVDTILYMTLTVYLENVIPSQYGVRKPWYYIFLPSTWSCCARRSVQVAPAVTEAQDETLGFEADPPDLKAGIVIQNLGTQFGKVKVATENIPFKMFDGQITVLLGHNGAGKTTTLSILTGLLPPSSGTAIINGYDINTQMDDVRSSVGICSKNNLLFNELSVEEHMIFFGRLKGLSNSQAKAETTLLLQEIRLAHTRYVLANALFASQKRILSLGIALIGRSKVLILDEPTLGMDLEAKNNIWDVLIGQRANRTILLTSQFMEEANILGDRIAIMAGGKLQCCGTRAYLNRFYGVGYTLKMTIEENSDKEAILTSVQKHVPSAFLKFKESPTATEIAITLPTEDQPTNLYPAMFTDLIGNKEKLGIRTMSLSLTTMDEVFVKVGETLTGENQTQDSLTGGQVAASPPLVKVKGCQLVLQQFWGLLLKKILYTLRQPNMFLLQVLIPIFFLIGSISLLNAELAMNNAPPPLTMTLSDYPGSKTLYYSTSADLKMSYPEVVGPSASYTNPRVVMRLLETREKDEGDYRAHYIVAAEMDKQSVTALFSRVAYHANPLSLNLISNAILKSRSPKEQHSIEVTNHPFYDDLGTLEELFGYKGGPRNVSIPLFVGIILSISFALFAASFFIFPTEEKICQAKQLQFMTGVSPLVFWSSSFLWDFFVVAFVAGLMVACLAIFEVHGMLTAFGGAGIVFLIMMTFGFTAIPFSYLASLYAKSVIGGFAFISSVHFLSGLLFAFVIYKYEGDMEDGIDILLRIFGFAFPNFGVTISMMKYFELALYNSRCKMIPENHKKSICEGTPEVPLFPNLYVCCATCKMPTMKRVKESYHKYGDSQSLGTCFKQIPYLLLQTEDPDRYQKTSTFPGIGQELIYLFILGVIYHIIFLLCEYKVFRKRYHVTESTTATAFPGPAEENVVEESNRVQYMIQTGRVDEDALVVGNLCKSYDKNFTAIANLSFGVHYGECFGILGGNGSGKTTTLRMLTGDEIRSSGNAFGFNCSLEKNRSEFLKNIGYCPQNDAVIETMTGRETLELFGRLRGVPGRRVKSEANKWLSKMGLLDAGNVKCKNYSGGMKRKLSTGVALIGDPKIIFLDEPTSGVDPVSRQNFGKVLVELRDQGQSIVLTSQSMEECEPLCSRLGIMVNGQFLCFGGVEHLKARYAQGFSLTLKLKPYIPVDHPGVLALQGEISLKFAPCALKDQHENVLNYQLYNYAMPWNELFQIMEDLRVHFQEFMEDYTVIETRLEEVFMDFARLQYPQHVAKESKWTKCLTCQYGGIW